MKKLSFFFTSVAIIFSLLLIERIMTSETAGHKFARVAEQGVVYATRLDIDTKAYRVGGVEVTLSADETGAKVHLWTQVAQYIEENWVDTFAGYKGFSWFKPQMDNMIASGIPVDAIKLLPHAYQLSKVNIANSALSDLQFCERQGWRDMNMLMIVAKHGCFDCVEYMVEVLKADVNHVSCQGYTAAALATRSGHYKVARYLVPKMSDMVKNTQLLHKDNGHSIYDLAPLFDPEDEHDASTSTERFRYFLWSYGIVSGVELNNESRCFPNRMELSDPRRMTFVREKLYYREGVNLHKESDIGYCMFLLRQYEYRCYKHGQECDKQKQISEYIEERGYSLSNWSNDKGYFEILIPKFNPTNALSIDGGVAFRYEMEALNGKKCNSVFSDCRQKLKRERRSI